MTSSGSLVTLLAAVGAFVSKGDGTPFPDLARWPLLVAVVLFALAAGLGIWTNWSRTHTVAHIETLRKMRTSQWGDDAVDARNCVAHINIETIDTLRRSNGMKASVLSAALVAQVLALIALGIAVSIIAWP